MNKNFSFLYDTTIEKPNTTQPFSVIRAKDVLQDEIFNVWKLSYKKQNIHAHDYYQLWYIFKGSCDHTIDNRKIHLTSGDIIIIPPYSYHSMYNGTDNLIVIGIDFTDSFLEKASSDDEKISLSSINPIVLSQMNISSVFSIDRQIEGLILECFNEYMQKNTFYKTIIKGNIIKLVICVNRMSDINTHKESSHRYIVNEILKYIQNNLSKQIKIEDLCALTNSSPSLIGQCFKKETDKTIIEYVNTLKIDKAKQLLKESDLTITNISYDLGFNDMAYFNRVFKKLTGNSPNNYRKKHTNL